MNWKKGIAVALSAISIMAIVAGCGSNTATNEQKKIVRFNPADIGACFINIHLFWREI